MALWKTLLIVLAAEAVIVWLGLELTAYVTRRLTF
jgi:hypothetical protein